MLLEFYELDVDLDDAFSSLGDSVTKADLEGFLIQE